MYARVQQYFEDFNINPTRLRAIAPEAGSAAPNATPTDAGVLRQMPATANLAAAPTAADFNALLQKLRDAGHMAP